MILFRFRVELFFKAASRWSLLQLVDDGQGAMLTRMKDLGR